MSLTQFIIGGLFGLLMVYVAARLISAAYFKSKQEHEQRKAS